MLVIGLVIKEMVTVKFNGLMELCIMDNGDKIKLMDLVYFRTQMVIYMRVFGKIIGQMDRDHLNNITARYNI
jgi:hypothetical protein